MLYVFSPDVDICLGVADVTIRQSYKLMLPRAKDLFPADFKFTTPIENLPQNWESETGNKEQGADLFNPNFRSVQWVKGTVSVISVDLKIPHVWSDLGLKGTVVNRALLSLNGGCTSNYAYSPLKSQVLGFMKQFLALLSFPWTHKFFKNIYFLESNKHIRYT